jgi:hypothetical protein
MAAATFVTWARTIATTMRRHLRERERLHALYLGALETVGADTATLVAMADLVRRVDES